MISLIDERHDLSCKAVDEWDRPGCFLILGSANAAAAGVKWTGSGWYSIPYVTGGSATNFNYLASSGVHVPGDYKGDICEYLSCFPRFLKKASIFPITI
jgi:hypothetical protein